MSVEIKVEVKAGNKASMLGESYCYEGVDWSNPCDRCYSDGNGVVFLNCEDQDAADFVMEQLDEDERVEAYDVLESDSE